jgi:hypothetical protein
MLKLHAKIVRVDRRAELNFFNLVGMLMLLGFFLLFGLFVTILPKIHEPTNRRRGVRRYLDKIHAFCPGHINGIWEGVDPELITIVADDSDFAGTDFPINPYERRRSGGTRRKRATQDALIG